MSTSPGEHRAEPQAERARIIPTDTFANRLMLARATAGHLSIREAADICAIGRGAWTNWERGARPVDLLEIVETISAGLGIDRDWLLFGGPLAQEEPRKQRRLRSVADPTDRNRCLSDAITGPADSQPARPVTTRQAPPDNRPNGRAGTSGPAPRTRRPARLPRPNVA